MKPIRNRRPTKSDADQFGNVELYYRVHGVSGWIVFPWDSVSVQEPGMLWRPIDQTPPPEPEPGKPERRRFKNHVGGGFASTVESLEVLPGDPPDLDALLKAIDRKFFVMTRLPFAAQEWIQQVVDARHGEGGEE